MSTQIETETTEKVRHCPMYKVIMHNDPKTTMDFVVKILTDVFNKEFKQATKIMWQIHENGHGLAGVYSLEQAEFRVDLVHSQARAAKFPLTCTIEPDE